MELAWEWNTKREVVKDRMEEGYRWRGLSYRQRFLLEEMEQMEMKALTELTLLLRMV